MRGALCALLALPLLAAEPVLAAEPAPAAKPADAGAPSPAHCEAALERLEAEASAQGDAGAWTRLGRCLLALGRAADAAAAFEAAARADDSAVRRLEWAIALYHARRLDEAERLLDALAGELDRDPRLHFYRGLVRLERGEAARGAARLDHARRIAPEQVEPIASYYAGVAWIDAGDRERGIEALERIAADWPGTPWAERAGRVLARLEGRRRPRPWAELEIGGEYDSNVVLLGRGVDPGDIADEADARGAWRLAGGVELPAAAGLVGVGAAWAGSRHADLTDFDVQYPSLSLYGSQPIGARSDARLQYDLGHAWVGGDPFVWTHDLEASLRHAWRRGGASALTLGFFARDYRVRSPLLPRERDRDGTGVRAELGHRWPLPRWLDVLRTHAAFEYYDADVEYTYAAWELGVRARAALPAAFSLEAGATWVARRFEHPSTFPDPVTLALSRHDRRDDLVDLRAELVRGVGRGLSLGTRVRWERRISNVQVFDYSRVVAGLFATLRIGAE